MSNPAYYLDTSAERCPDAVLAVYENLEFSYRDMHRWASQLANGLRSHGLGFGDRIALCCTNRPGFLIAYYGILKIGATVVVLSTGLKERDIAEQLADSGAKAFLFFDGLGSDVFAHRALEAAARVPGCEKLWVIPPRPEQPSTIGDVPALSDLMAGQSARYTTAPCQEKRTAIIPYTSGSTGQPKGVEITHLNIWNMVALNLPLSDWQSGSVRLVANPLFHVMGQITGLNLPVSAGQKLVLLEKFDPARAWELIESEGVTYMAGVPMMYKSLLDNARDVNERRVRETLRICGTGAAPLPAEWSGEFEARFGTPILAGYGATETTSVVTWNCPNDRIKVDSVGKPLSGMLVRAGGIAFEHGSPGARGEIYVRSPGVMKGYLNRPEATKRAFEGLWYRTGDMGVLDEGGYLHIEGRADEMIIRRDANVSPTNIENVIREHPDVHDVAVVGADTGRVAQDIVVFVVARPGTTLDQRGLNDWLKGELPDDQLPDEVRVVPVLPRTDTGKVARRELIETL